MFLLSFFFLFSFAWFATPGYGFQIATSKPLSRKGTITWLDGLCQQVDGRNMFYVQKKGYEYCEGNSPLDRLPPYGMKYSFNYLCCWANKTVELLNLENRFGNQLKASEDRGDAYQFYFHVLLACFCVSVFTNIGLIVGFYVRKYLKKKNKGNQEHDQMGEQTCPKNQPNGLSNENFDVGVPPREDQHEVPSNTPLNDCANEDQSPKGHVEVDVDKDLNSSSASPLGSDQYGDGVNNLSGGHPVFTPPRTTTTATNGTALNVTPHCLTSGMLSVVLDDIPLDRSASEDSTITLDPNTSERREAPNRNSVTDTTL